MTDLVKVAMITAAAPLFLSAVTAVISFLNRLALKAYHLEVNSRLDELLAVTRLAAHTEGVQQERARDKSGDL